jgi:SAM-dependent methyltransferase
MDDQPWLRIPADDYEAHMSAVGQSAALRDLFGRVYAEVRPARLAILGCTTGSDLELVDPAMTEVVAGVDLNPDYLDIARARWGALGPRLHLVRGDVLQAELPPGPYDLVHAALLLEYVEPNALLRRIHQWLSPDGTCSLVTQDPAPGVGAVSSTGYESLQSLRHLIALRTAEEVAHLADHAGFRLVSRQAVRWPTGKSLTHSIFAKTGSPPPRQ